LNSSGIEISSVDLSNSLNVVINCRDISIKLGNTNIKDKLNFAFRAIESNNLKDKKGYFDLSFEGNPVAFVEK
jgi:cell division protein FtsQ